MKVCLFTNTYRPHVGGVARAVETLASELEALGHQVLVVAPSFPGDEHEPDAGVLRVPALQRFNGSDFSVPVPLPYWVGRRIRRFGPDVVHAHHPFLLGDAALRFAYERELPLVFTHHTLYEHYTHYVPFDSRALKRFVVRLATAYANCCDQVIAPSASVADLIRRRGVLTPVATVPTGIDSQRFAEADGAAFRDERGVPHGACVVGHVGRLAREKNLGLLGEGMARALQREPSLFGVIVGDGPESPRLRQCFERAGVDQRLRATGKLTGKPLVDAYAAMDVFAFTSCTETQGMVLAEAMAAGTPVIAVDGPGVRDIVSDGSNGRLLPAGTDADGLADVLVEAARAPQMSEWRRAARATGAAWDRRRCAERVGELYERLEGGRARDHGIGRGWDRLRGRIEAEWELVAAKADSAGHTVRPSRRD